ncbi:MAG: putative colanic acid biosynthesis acetyltransferase [Planctomycetota bacterium]|nr:putative colanic acid biosynthesis acetyltransferase [Planctomycetota bacterium]
MRTDPGSFRNPHSLGNKLGRLLWRIVWALLFRPSPWFMEGWRLFLLRLFGAKFGSGRVHPTARIWAPWRLVAGNQVYIDHDVYLYNAFGTEIGDRVVISFGSVLCTATHDYRRPDFPLTGRPIRVASDVWIAAQAFIAPGVTINDGAVVGARTFLTRDAAPWTVVSGNPAAVVSQRVVKGQNQASQAPASNAPASAAAPA